MNHVDSYLPYYKLYYLWSPVFECIADLFWLHLYFEHLVAKREVNKTQIFQNFMLSSWTKR